MRQLGKPFHGEPLFRTRRKLPANSATSCAGSWPGARLDICAYRDKGNGRTYSFDHRIDIRPAPVENGMWPRAKPMIAGAHPVNADGWAPLATPKPSTS